MNYLTRHFIPALAILLVLVFGIGYFTLIDPIEFSNTGEPNVLAEIFKSPGAELKISSADKAAYTQYAYYYLDTLFNRGNNIDINVPELGEYDSIYLTFLYKGATRCSQKGWNDIDVPDRTRLDIEDAVNRCVKDQRFGGEIGEAELDNITIVFDISYNKRLVPTSLKNIKKKVELGIHSLELYHQGDRESFFKASVPITQRFSIEKTLEELCQKGKLDKTCYADSDTEIYQLDSVQFFGNRQQELVDLYRYNVLVDPEEVNNNLLQSRLELIPQWFLNNIKTSTGMLEYQYFPNKNSYSSDQNDTRQLATTWAMSKLQSHLNINSLDMIIESTLKYYINLARCNDSYCYIWLDGESKLSYSAFALMTLSEYGKYSETDEWIQKLADGILAQQNGDGSYNTYFSSSKNTGVDYYPGEAMLSLMKVYRRTEDKKYLSSVEKAFKYYREYWRNNKNTAFVPWHTQADYLLFLETKDSEIADFVFEMNDWLIENHQIKSSQYIDQIGGFPKKNPRLNASTQTEGMNDAYLLAKLVGDEKHEKRYREAIRLTTPFVLNTQFTKDSAFYVINPDKTVGGFKFSLTENDQRIDYTQHGLMALVKVLENGIFN